MVKDRMHNLSEQLVQRAILKLGIELTSNQYQQAIKMLSELPKDSEQLDYLVENIVQTCSQYSA